MILKKGGSAKCLKKGESGAQENLQKGDFRSKQL